MTNVPNVITVKDWGSSVKENLARLFDFGVRYEGESGGVYFKNEFLVSDIDFKFRWEITDPIETLDVYALPKPLCALYIKPFRTDHTNRPVAGVLLVEFQLIVNTEPQGLLNLNGLTSLIFGLCDPVESKGKWMRIGLAPRLVEEGDTIEGGELLNKLKGRLIVRSVLVTFDITGDFYGK